VTGVTVWACAGDVQPDGEGEIHACGYTSASSQDGTFRIGNVKASRTPYSVLAFVDDDNDGRYSPNTETGGIEHGVALIASLGDSVVGIEIAVTAPGTDGAAPRTESAGEGS
jgi:hypothetical protein